MQDQWYTERTTEKAEAVLVTPLGMALSERTAEMRKHSTPDRTCPRCGTSFATSHPTKKFCCYDCLIAYRNANRMLRLKPNVRFDCVICGQTVEKYVTPSSIRPGFQLYCSRSCQGKAQRRGNHPLWKGGRYVSAKGYVHVHDPDHPFAAQNGYVLEHRRVVEKQIGRFLRREEVVHHINGDTQDNRIENLMLFPTNAEHKSFEDALRQRNEAGRFLPTRKGGAS